MATLDEIASGVVQMLAHEGLNPPPVELRNHSPAEFAEFVTMVIDRCYTQDVPLKAVNLSPDFGGDLRHLVDWLGQYRGVPIHFDERLGRSIQFVPGSRIH